MAVLFASPYVPLNVMVPSKSNRARQPLRREANVPREDEPPTMDCHRPNAIRAHAVRPYS